MGAEVCCFICDSCWNDGFHVGWSVVESFSIGHYYKIWYFLLKESIR